MFWACGVTPQAAVAAARLEFCITHAPGHMLVTDLKNSDLALSSYRNRAGEERAPVRCRFLSRLTLEDRPMKTLVAALAGTLIAGSALAQDLPKTHLRITGGLSNLTAYNDYEKPFWTKTIPELSKGRVTAEIKGFNEMGLKGPELLRLISSGVIEFGTATLSSSPATTRSTRRSTCPESPGTRRPRVR